MMKSINPPNPASVSLAAGLLPQGFEPALALAEDYPYRLTLQPGKIVQLLGEQDDPEIGDILCARRTGVNQLILGENIENNSLPVRKR